MLEKQFGNHFLKKIIKYKKDFSDLPTLIFLGMSLETHIFFLGIRIFSSDFTTLVFLSYSVATEHRTSSLATLYVPLCIHARDVIVIMVVQKGTCLCKNHS